MSKPTEDEAREVSRRIPDEPSDVTFEVERHVVREGAGPARVVLPGMVKFFHAEDVETQRRTIRIGRTRVMTSEFECDSQGPKGFWCVRPLDHDQDHVATDGQEILDVWAQEPAVQDHKNGSE